ncbi:amidohydrolase family protein [Aureliella helgolandensis]|uniref:Amidohydrolase n=1 Tax=Aureliella helgolandensis TaxID=2527968 RepID=A0A518G8H0_9BACT|nr:amidohydrolase family protein [Aureliella helgolandensis]QDV24886.1 Amidohydrolase [Aureliella helgolandensis]
MRIDSHHHLWDYSAEQYGWINSEMSLLRRDFTAADLEVAVASSGVSAAITVQARQSILESQWLLGLAEDSKMIAGVVGWVELAGPSVCDELDLLVQSPWLKGVRHVVQDEPDDFLLDADFGRGIAQLNAYGLVYDLLIYARQLPQAISFVDQHPNQVFVLDHIAKPTVRESEFDQAWARNIKELSLRPNVSCKFSGVVTEVRDASWSAQTLQPYWDVALESFGPERLMFGSDWPVCLLRSEYKAWVAAVEELTGGLSAGEQKWFWADSAIKAYGLQLETPKDGT